MPASISQSWSNLSLNESNDSLNNAAGSSAGIPSQIPLERQSSDIALLAQWEEARQKYWSVNFSKQEKREIEKFKTPQDLLQSLKKLEEKYIDHPATLLIQQMTPPVQSLDTFAGLLATALAIRTLGTGSFFETTLLWGSLNLAIKGAVRQVEESREALEATVDVLKRIRQQLRILSMSFDKEPDLRQIRQELVDMFIALIGFWTEAVARFRNPPFYLRDSFAEIARQLQLPKGDENDMVQSLKNWLSQTQKTWLCVFDNVDDLKIMVDNHFLPWKGDIIITTRYKEQAQKVPGNSHSVALDVLDKEDAQVMFASMRERYKVSLKPPYTEPETEAMNKLLKHFGGHALGLEQMAAYIAYEDITFTECLNRYEKKGQSVLRFEGMSNDLAQYNLAMLWNMQFDLLMSDTVGKSALNLLAMLSLLAPDDIPCALFANDEDDVSLPDAYDDLCNDEAEFEAARDRLVKLALIKKRDTSLSLHRLVQRAFDNSLSADKSKNNLRQEAFSTVAKLINARFPKMGGSASLFDHWEECSRWLPHCQSLAAAYVRQESARKRDRLATSPDLEELLKNCAWYLYEISECPESLILVEIAQRACTDKESLLYSQLCNNAGCVDFEMNRNVPCLKNLSKCLELRLKLLPHDDPDVANTYNNLANYYASVGDAEEAIKMHNKSFEISKDEAETAPAYAALSHLGLGKAYVLSARFDDAEREYERARSLVAPLDTEGLWVMAIYHFDHGNLHCARQEFDKAFGHFEKGCNIVQKQPKSMLRAAMLYKRAFARTHLGQLTDALNDLDFAIAIAEGHKLLGHVARSLWWKANVVDRQPVHERSEENNVKFLRLRAEMLKARIKEDGNLGDLPGGLSEEETYDRLTCLYHR
ncbi:hypothetical protein N0V90_007261 [Kalmusia sp. IMI 367209]|nr:hypothetical protein N0V90_007261 [Kalmusia sp. IMI 367209]